jgi:murein DD-endopeptidase MepM/ murein hydrolase activator NlpD
MFFKKELYIGVGILAIILLLLSWIIFLRPHYSGRQEKSSVNIKVAIFQPKSGENFLSVLKRAVIVQPTAEKIINTLIEINFKFNSLKPTDSFKFFYRNDTMVKFIYKKNYNTCYTFNNIEIGNMTISMSCQEIVTKIILVKGEIKSSLYESMLEIGEKPILIANYTDILAWEIDFFTETQNGDSFFVLVEKKFEDSTFVEYGQINAVRYKGQFGDFSGYFFVDASGNRDYYDTKGQSLRKAFLKSPLRYSYISSYFSGGRYHPILKIVRPHRGIDYVAPTGTPVSAIGNGVVTFAGWQDGYGRFVELSHSQRFKSRYGHLSRFGSGIRSGKSVTQGQIIGYVGATGLATGPHLHFELLQNGNWVNPLRVIPPRAEPVKPEYFTEFQRKSDSLAQILYSIK